MHLCTSLTLLLTQVTFAQDTKENFAETVYNEGFWLITKDDKMRTWGWYQGDFKFFPNYPTPNSFVNRRVRIALLGSLEYDFNYIVMAAFERSIDLVQIAWLEYAKLNWLKIRVGQFKEPYSMEELSPDINLDFLERSLFIRNFSPAQDLGIMLHGKLLENRIEYAIGGFNGRGKTREDNNNNKEIAARVSIAPFKNSALKHFSLMNLGFNITTARMSEAFAEKGLYTAGNTKFIVFDQGVTHQGERLRMGMDFESFSGPASIKAEYNQVSFSGVKNSVTSLNVYFTGWYIAATYLITGEDKRKSNQPIIPKNNFDPKNKGSGAFEVGLRYEQFSASRLFMNEEFANGPDRVEAIVPALLWIMNRHIRVGINYYLTGFKNPVNIEGINVKREQLFLFRCQFEI